MVGREPLDGPADKGVSYVVNPFGVAFASPAPLRSGRGGSACRDSRRGCTSAVSQQDKPGASTPKAGGTVNIVQTADVSPTTMLTQNNPNLSVNRLIFNFLIDL